MINKKRIMNRGFTLIEIMTAVSIFAVVTTISMGSILTIFDVNRKAESVKTVMDNLNLAIESMAREMRFGTNYVCGHSSPIVGGAGSMPAPNDCPPGASSVAFLANGNVNGIVYRQNGATIEKSLGGNGFVPVTASEIVIEDLDFYVIGSRPSSAEGTPQQPKVLIRIRGEAGTKEGTKSEFTMQTLVSQRKLDNQ